MPINGSGIHVRLAGTVAVPDTEIESGPYNDNIEDLIATLNAKPSRSGALSLTGLQELFGDGVLPLHGTTLQQLQSYFGLASVPDKPRTAPALFAGTLVQTMVGKVRRCDGPGEAKHTIDLRSQFEALYGSNLGNTDVYWDPGNISLLASDSAIANRGEKRLPYRTLQAAQAHANRRYIYFMGKTASAGLTLTGSNSLISAGNPRPVMVLPMTPTARLRVVANDAETASSLQTSLGWVQAGDLTNLWEVTPVSSSPISAIYINESGVRRPLECFLTRAACAAGEYGWYRDPGTRKISICDGARVISTLAAQGFVEIVWSNATQHKMRGLEVYFENIDFVGDGLQVEFEAASTKRPILYLKNSTLRDIADFGVKNLGGITACQNIYAVECSYDVFSYDAVTHLTVDYQPEGAEIECLVPLNGGLHLYTARFNYSLSPGVRNVQGSSCHDGWVVRINCEYENSLGQSMADTNDNILHGSINIGCIFGNPRGSPVTNPDATPGPMLNAFAADYDTLYPSTEGYNVWFDGCRIGGDFSSYGYRSLGGAFRSYNTSFTGVTANTDGVPVIYNPETGV